jgi:hypothetical protein
MKIGFINQHLSPTVTWLPASYFFSITRITSATLMRVHQIIQFLVLGLVFAIWNFWTIWNFEECDVSREYVDLKRKNKETNDKLKTKSIEQSGGDPAVLRLENDFGNTGWCRNSTCNSSILCQPCNRRFLIIFASGRSASTTLTWMMDSLPGVRMSGENNDLLRKMYELFESTFDSKFYRGVGRRVPFGRNEIAEGSLSCILQKTIELITPPELPIHNMEEEKSMIIGFKTIRSFRDKEKDEMKLFVDFLEKNLPCARYLINYRSDSEALKKSVETLFHWTKDVATKIETEKRQLKLLYELLGSERAYLLDSSEWIKDIGILNQALEWLGYNPSCHFSELLEFNTRKRYMNTKTHFSDSSAFANCTRL